MVGHLRDGGDDPVSFDIVHGDDVENGASLIAAAHDADVIVHLAAVDDAGGVDHELSPGAVVGSPEKVLSTTVVGTANVLVADDVGSEVAVLAATTSRTAGEPLAKPLVDACCGSSVQSSASAIMKM